MADESARAVCLFRSAACAGTVELFRARQLDDQAAPRNNECTLCDVHCRCAECGAFVCDGEFSVVGGVGVCCHRPRDDGSDPTAGCLFPCAGCGGFCRASEFAERDAVGMWCHYCAPMRCSRCGWPDNACAETRDGDLVCPACSDGGDSSDCSD